METIKRIFTTTILLGVLISLMSSCSGKHGDWKIKTKQEVCAEAMTDFASTYIYDSLGRLSAVIGASPESNMVITHDHDTIKESFPNKGHKYDHVYILNAQGLVIKENGVGSFTYDSGGFLIRAEPYGSIGIRTILNGDMITSTRTGDSIIAGRSVYTFCPELDTRDDGKGYRGRHNTHLIKTEVSTFKDVKISNSFTYTFDDKGRVQKMSEDERVDGMHFHRTTTYTYYE